MMRRKNLEVTFLIVIISILIVTFLVSGFFIISYTRNSLIKQFEDECEYVMEDFTEVSGYLIYEYDFKGIEREINAKMQTRPIVYIEVADPWEKIIVSKSRVEPIKSEDIFEREALIYYEEKIVGRVKMGFSIEEINQSIFKLELIIGVSLALLCSILFFSVFILMKKLIIEPIDKLTYGAKEVSSGNFDYSIIIKEENQFGDLANTFNQMTKELKSLYDNLEQKVKERTKELKEKNKELERFNKLFVGRELSIIKLKEEIKALKEKLGGKK